MRAGAGMKQIAIVIALCVGAWYFFIGGRKLDEAMARDYYRKEAHAIYSRDAQALCKQLSRKAVIESKVTMMGRTVESSHNREEACEAVEKTFELFRAVGDRMGGILTIEYEYHIDAVEVATDRKSAVVTGTSVLKMGEAALQYKTSFSQRLERELGQMRLVHSSDATVVRMGGAGAMSQSDFFRK
ncbi:hypothetical protein VCH24_32110 [Variovorax boronicumulans]|nr:hypothetical protein BKP43_43530 [Variovorax boronicumulans]GER18187.1 hypothetical protein VCH24_32110 [Variovorax boronicumulans]